MDPLLTAKMLQDALALHRASRRGEAMALYVQVLQANPENADALYYVAVIAMQEGHFDNGVKLAQRALGFDSKQARLHNLLGQGYLRLDRPKEALESYDRAIALQPDHADAHGNRAGILAELGLAAEALAGFDRALALRPDSPEDWCNRGAALHDLDRTGDALASYDRAIALRPDFAGAHYNRADMLRDLGQIEDAQGVRPAPQLDAALAGYNQAIALDPRFAEAHFGRALVHLLRGDWADGWRDYEARTGVGVPTFKPLPNPRWTGEPLPDGRLVLVTEQGLGDTINICRFAPLLAAQGFDVTILARPAMKPLLSTLAGVTIETSAEALAAEPRPIRWLPMMSLPAVLGVTPESVPADVPYLTASPERIAAWAARLGGGFKIGINWASGHSHNRHFTRRDIPLLDFAPLAALPEVRLISLQKGPHAAQIELVPFRERIETLDADPHPDADFFLDTAAVMMNLDLVITCDTSVAHLAGALGRPVFTALPAVADWRWLLGRDDSPWYPTMRLFRQRRRGDWADVMAAITQAVRARASATSAPSQPPASR